MKSSTPKTHSAEVNRSPITSASLPSPRLPPSLRCSPTGSPRLQISSYLVIKLYSFAVWRRLHLTIYYPFMCLDIRNCVRLRPASPCSISVWRSCGRREAPLRPNYGGLRTCFFLSAWFRIIPDLGRPGTHAGPEVMPVVFLAQFIKCIVKPRIFFRPCFMEAILAFVCFLPFQEMAGFVMRSFRLCYDFSSVRCSAAFVWWRPEVTSLDRTIPIKVYKCKLPVLKLLHLP